MEAAAEESTPVGRGAGSVSAEETEKWMEEAMQMVRSGRRGPRWEPSVASARCALGGGLRLHVGAWRPVRGRRQSVRPAVHVLLPLPSLPSGLLVEGALIRFVHDPCFPHASMCCNSVFGVCMCVNPSTHSRKYVDEMPFGFPFL